jgi:hypothetical protein
LLLGSVPLNRVGLGGAIWLPVTGVVGAPLASAVAADLAILRIEGELVSAVLATALPLAWFVRTGRLLQVDSRWFERLVAETATPQIHPFRVRCSFSIRSARQSSLPEKTLHWIGINPATTDREVCDSAD